ncbi:pectin lyase fold/virulence factor [Crassisporium funariophilum]|nr:pectin lyase fold/virulence factor [Crassisporium funariophilum]
MPSFPKGNLVLVAFLATLGFSGFSRAAECTVAHSDDGVTDDSPSIIKAFTDCATDSVITFAQANYSAYTPVTLANLKNVTVLLNGNLNLPNNISRVQHEINITLNHPSTYATPWFYIDGTDVQIIGSDDFQWGRFNGFGQQWWDIGNRTLRPQLATFNVTNGLLRGLKVIKPVAWGWNLPGKNIRVENHFVDAKPDNGTRDNTVSFPFNTDGFNLSGQNITVDGYYGHNGDDCVSVISGARDIVAMNGYCGFSSHGLSIGSLGRNGAVHTVQNVLFKNWTMDGAVYGARFKSWTGGQGWADNITWEDITLVNVSTGIFITQNYYDQDKGPRPDNINKTSTKLSNVVYKNFTGSLTTNWTDGTCISSPCWNYIPGIDATKGIIFDLFPDTALNISVMDINIHPFNQPANGTTVICDPAALTPGEQDTLGFKCASGPYIVTAIVPGKSGARGLTSAMGTGWAAMALVAVLSGLFF